MSPTSPEWLERAAAAADDAEVSAAAAGRFGTIAMHIDGDTRALVVADGRVLVVTGVDAASRAADVTLTQSAANAARIATGETSAQRSFLDGDLRVDGDVDVLVHLAPVVAALDAAIERRA